MARIVYREAQLTTAAWMGDFGSRDHLIPGGARIDPAQWASISHTITVTEPVSIGHTQLTVASLTTGIPQGTILTFGAQPVTTSAPAVIGATTVAIAAAAGTIADNATATLVLPASAPLSIPSGTAIGRTLAEQATNTPFGVAAAADDEIFLIVNDVYDARTNPDVELYRPNSIVKENFLPQVINGSMIAGVLTKLRAAYICTRGVA
jgi:hypothetical protein